MTSRAEMRSSGGFFIVIPSRAFDRGKSRLAPLLGTGERRRFSRQSLRHVATAARAVAGAGRTAVVSRSGEVLGLARRLGLVALRERRRGLNAASTQGAGFARSRDASALLVLHADLPEITRADVRFAKRALARHPGVVLAPDRKREGTNAIGTRPAGGWRFCFGPGSFSRHLAEARRERRRVRILQRAGLARDVDSPGDYLALERD